MLLASVLGHSFCLQRPRRSTWRLGRWIRELARKPGEAGGTFSAAPNFAFRHAAVRGVPQTTSRRWT